MENPIKMNDPEVPPLQETSICWLALSFLGDFDLKPAESMAFAWAGAWEAEAKRTETKRKADL